MAFGAVFTTSAGGDIGGGRAFTRLRGQLLVGQPADGGNSSGPGGSSGYNGTRAAPIYSFYNRPNMGIYGHVMTTSGGAQYRAGVDGFDLLAFSTAGVAPVTTSAASAGGFYSTAATAPLVFIPASTGALSTAATPILHSTYSVPLVFDTLGKQLWIYSSNTGWVGIGPTSSGGNLWVTSSAA